MILAWPIFNCKRPNKYKKTLQKPITRLIKKPELKQTKQQIKTS